jgi:hypothetical protein
MGDDPIPGLYERLVTPDLKRVLELLRPAQIILGGLDAADAHVAMSEHLRRVLEHALLAFPEEERLMRKAQLCNALILWLHQHAPHVVPGEVLTLPPEVLREIKSLDRGAAFSESTPQPLVPLSSADLLVNARGEPSVGAAIEREIYSADRVDLLCAFVRWNGLRVVGPALECHRQAGRPLRVITTVYTAQQSGELSIG